MKDNANTEKLTLWWPNAANDAAELDVIVMPTPGPGSAWEYKYGNVPSSAYDNSDGGLASVTAAADPTDIYRFAWSTADPQKMGTQDGLPPITSTRWNPDVAASTNTADELNMTFYRTLGSADSTSLVASGRRQAWGVIYQPNTGNAYTWHNLGDDVEWIAETSTSNNNGGNSNNDGAMMLAQGLAAGAALLAAFSF